MNGKYPFCLLRSVMNRRPQAVACIRGSSAYPALSGCVYFYQTERGVLVAAQVSGLPAATPELPHRIFAFHIHSGAQCSGTASDPFAAVLGHYNPEDVPHPYHAGDLPPLFGNRGYAFQVFYTERFTVREILHKTVVIHAGPDDFTSQPAGNAGEKIACGEIRPCEGFA